MKRSVLYSLVVAVAAFVLSACSSARTAEMDKLVCNKPRTISELVNCASRFGTIQSYEVQLASRLNAGSQSCPTTLAWNNNDTVLVLTYADTTTFWRVANIQPDRGRWVQGGNPQAAGLSKNDVISLFALPNCSGTGSAWWTNCSLSRNCNCPCDTRMPADSVIRYVEKIVLPPNIRMEFGVAGTNLWGPGGGLQWHLLDTNVSSFIVHVHDWN